MRHFIKKGITLAVTVSICLSLMVIKSDCAEDPFYRYQGYPNLYLLTVINGGDADSALEMSNKEVYIPAGVYTIKKPISIDSGTIVGAGMDKTIIVADFENPATPIIMSGGTSYISDIQFCFKEGLVTGQEQSGERVGMFTGNYWPSQKGAAMTNVKFSNVGTGIWSPGTVKPETIGKKSGGLESYQSVCFSTTFDNIVIQDFSYRGIDFSAPTRTGNLWRNVSVSSGKYACNSAFCFEGEESECSIDRLTVFDTRSEKPICLNGARGIDAGVITLQNIELIDDKTVYIYFNNSSGYIRHLSLNSGTVLSAQTLIEIGDTEFVADGFDSLNQLHIGCLTVSDVKGMTFAAGFSYFKRKAGFTSPFYITLDEYYYHAQQVEKQVYRQFPTSDENLIYTKKGQIITKGSTIMRPEYRLCPYYSKYEDTDVGKTLIWDGEAWK